MADRPSSQGSAAYTLGQLLLSVLAISVILYVALGVVPGAVEQRLALDRDADPPADRATVDADALAQSDAVQPSPVVAVLPFGLDEQVAGPLLANLLRQYLPGTTNAHADGLRDTLPPGEDPRMIVILPDEQATF